MHCQDNEMELNKLCCVLVELAQLNSELLHQELDKALPEDAEFEGTSLRSFSDITVNGKTFSDLEDLYRLGYLERKCPHPVNMLFMMTEGHVEDYFGAWCHDDPQDDMFNPDD